jgi:hypothetical protein
MAAGDRVAIAEGLEDEARRLLARAAASGLTARVLGGVAIRLLLGPRLHPAFIRELQDIDLITTRRDAPALERLIADSGWTPEREFNALNGSRRLLFHEAGRSRKLDVFVERFEMCHALPLAERLTPCEDTLPAAELLMTKLQIVELNAKDRTDCYALLLGCPVTDADEDCAAIALPRMTELTARDWGLHHTFEINLERLHEGMSHERLGEDERDRIRDAIERIERAMRLAPKTRAWKVRGRIGERRRWYDEPEEVDR